MPPLRVVDLGGRPKATEIETVVNPNTTRTAGIKMIDPQN